ncbi:MAG: hypothetical protein JF614_29235 [Acidobacteria bacterium]|nr:hypothetical protein [Acidobacteriota bacterium]
MDLQDWQIRQIEAGLREADSGDFASDEEMAELLAKWTSSKRNADNPTALPESPEKASG